MIVLGSWCAWIAWSRRWGRDSRETPALVTWLVYAVYPHARNQTTSSSSRSSSRASSSSSAFEQVPSPAIERALLGLATIEFAGAVFVTIVLLPQNVGI
jgi:hypothetical protein